MKMLVRWLIVLSVWWSYSSSLAAERLHFELNQLKNDQVIQVNEKSWQGKYLLLAVGYTGCPDVCPTTMLDVSTAMKSLDKTPDKAAMIQPLFITIDPASDSLKDITQYAAFFDPRIVGLRAVNNDKLNDIVDQLRATYSYQFKGKPVMPPNLPKGYTVIHSTLIYLYSPDGQLLDTYNYDTNGKTLAQKILSVIDENAEAEAIQ